MQGRLGTPFLLAATLLLATLASAEEGTLTVASPVLVEGKADAYATEGAVVLHSAEPALLTLTLTAASARVSHVQAEAVCPVGSPQCMPVVREPQEDSTYRLDDVLLVATAATDRALDVAWSVHDGRILASTHGISVLAAEGVPFEPCEGCFGWWPGTHEPDGPYLEADAWNSTSNGEIRILLSGMRADVSGIHDDEPFRETYETGRTEETVQAGGVPVARRVAHEWLVLELEDARLVASGAVPGRLFGDLALAADGRTTFHDASGTLEGREEPLRDEDVTVPGELAIVPLAVVDGHDGPRLVLRAALVGAPPVPEEARAASLPPGSGAAAAGALGAMAVAALGVWLWPYWKYVATAAVVPLYSRIGRDEVLEHGKREEIFQLIKQNPGIHAHEICQRAAVGWGTTVYHLKLLEGHGLVIGKRNGRYKRFFATAGGAVRQGEAYAALRNDTAAAIARHVLAHPGCIQKEVCSALSLAPSLVTWHMNRLEDADLVKKVRDGRTVRYYAGGGWQGLQIGFGPTASVATAAVVDAGAN